MGLKQALERTGLFLEARLAAGLPSGETDLEALLLRFAHALRARLTEIATPAALGTAEAENEPRPLLAELLRRTQGALARVLLDQLATHAAQTDEGRSVWHAELPWRQGERFGVLQIRIERESDRPSAGQRRAPASPGGGWRVRLQLDPPGLGPIHAELHLAQTRTDVALWAENPATGTLIRNELAQLRADLEGAGLEVGGLDCQTGRPAVMAEPIPARPPFSLLEEKA